MERRRKHLDLISPTHSLLQVALDCIKDKEDQRPTAEQLCDHMIDLKESAAYHDSVEQTQSQALSAVDQEQEHKMRDTIEALTKQAHELQVHELNAMNQQLKEQINQKNTEIQQLKQQKGTLTKDFQERTQENEQVVNALQNSVEMKDAALQAKDRELQAKDAEIQELQRKIKDESGVATDRQRVVNAGSAEPSVGTRFLERGSIPLPYSPTFLTKPQSGVATGSLPMGSMAKGCTSVGTGQLNPVPTSLPKAGSGIDVEPNSAATRSLKLKWKDGAQAPFATCGSSVAVCGDDVFCCDSCSDTKVLQYNSGTKQWAVLPECPRKNFSIAVVNKQPTIIGGQHLGRPTNTLLSLQQEQKWIYRTASTNEIPSQ